MECLIPTCHNKVEAKGWCMKHYMRWRRHGDPLYEKRRDRSLPLEIRVMKMLKPRWCSTLRDWCWIYTGEPNGNGYGNHREVWEALIGAIPDGFELHHKCGIRTCSNVFKHIELKTHSEHKREHNWIELDNERIKYLRESGKLIQEIADELKVSVGPIKLRLRALGFDTSIRPPKTYCKRGHAMTASNIYIDSKGSKRCHTCLKAAYRKYDETRRNNG